jgi:hypothetical protein
MKEGLELENDFIEEIKGCANNCIRCFGTGKQLITFSGYVGGNKMNAQESRGITNDPFVALIMLRFNGKQGVCSKRRYGANSF